MSEETVNPVHPDTNIHGIGPDTDPDNQPPMPDQSPGNPEMAPPPDYPPTQGIELGSIAATALVGGFAAAETPPPMPEPTFGIHPDVRTQLNVIEQTALFWGGDHGAMIRNSAGRIRELLGLV